MNTWPSSSETSHDGEQVPCPGSLRVLDGRDAGIAGVTVARSSMQRWKAWSTKDAASSCTRWQEGRGIGKRQQSAGGAPKMKAKTPSKPTPSWDFARSAQLRDCGADPARPKGEVGGSVYEQSRQAARASKAGVTVSERVPHWVSSHEWNSEYLAVKRRQARSSVVANCRNTKHLFIERTTHDASHG